MYFLSVNKYVYSRFHSFCGMALNARCVSMLFRKASSLTVLIILLSSPLFAQETAPLEETPDFTTVSTGFGDILAASNVQVKMRDETTIALDIYRPAGNTSYSTLYAAGPFPHGIDMLTDTETAAGPVAWYVSQGYAVVVANVRGTGASGGDFAFFSREEQQDHYEIIEWIADQPWSDGKVAGTGAGYYAASQWQMAIQNPPHLACIAPINGTLDPFREWISPGGLSNNAFTNDWYDRKVRLANAYSADTPRLVNYDMRLAQLLHQGFDDYWRIRSSVENTQQINVPVFAIHDWSLARTQPGLNSTLRALDKLNVVNKILITDPAADTPLYQDTPLLAQELLPYYDWCFNGRPPDSSFIEVPRIRYLAKGQNTLKRESNWPPGNVRHEAWFLNYTPDGNNNSLATLNGQQDPGSLEISTFSSAENAARIRFVSAPLAQNLEIAGPLMLELYIASAFADAAFEVILHEEIRPQAPLTTVSRLPSFIAAPMQTNEAQPGADIEDLIIQDVMVSMGMLKASSRARDEQQSTEFSPQYALDGKQTLQPGQVTRLDIAMRQTSYRFSAGNRLILDIVPVNDGSIPETKATELVYHSRRYPSRLWLPVARVRQQATPIPLETAAPPAIQTDLQTDAEADRQQTEPELEDVRQFFVPR